MFAAINEARNQAIFRVVSPRITDRQWGVYLDTCARLGTSPDGPAPCLICIAENGADVPDARWRRRFAEVGPRIRTDAIFVLITPSAMARGILTAVNWIRPFAFRHSTASTWAEGLRALEAIDPSPVRRAEFEALRAAEVPVPA